MFAMDTLAPYADTDPRAFAAWVELQRRITPGEKLAAGFAATEFVMRLQEYGGCIPTRRPARSFCGQRRGGWTGRR